MSFSSSRKVFKDAEGNLTVSFSGNQERNWDVVCMGEEGKTFDLDELVRNWAVVCISAINLNGIYVYDGGNLFK